MTVQDIAIPRTKSPDCTLSALREGYLFIPGRCRRYGSDAFRTRLMLSPVVCMSGAEAAELFYGGDRFSRQNAMPVTVLKLLQDRGSVQLLEDAAHRSRKQMFLTLAAPERAERLAAAMADEWRRRLPRWQEKGTVVLFDEMRDILTRAVCAWAGIPLRDGEAERLTRDLSAMIESTGSVGPRNWIALARRRRSERWAGDIVERVGAGRLGAVEGTAVQVIAAHRDVDGERLDRDSAAVELLNLLRPVVAAARFIVFAALALHEHPSWQRAFAAADDGELEGFVQEVRRLSPFFPFIGGRARTDFEWRGHRFRPGDWVLLDLYGTCRDPGAWSEPEAFRPERFRDDPGAYRFVPQGGGNHLGGHRCPGEWLTIALMKEAVRLLTRQMTYRVPEQDLATDLSRIPALPRSGFVLADVRRTPSDGGC